ncbi:MAG: DUF2232 domain-containing protein [Spirochaetes bacterium]|nr:DUF2232 domain-containing protein [Spirochaetota bacterium]
MILLFSLIIGIAILFGSAVVFFKWPLKIYHLGLLLLILLISNFFSGSESLHLIISFLIVGSTSGFAVRTKKKFQVFLFISTLSITLISASNYYYLKIFQNTDVLQSSKQSFIDVIKKSEISESERNEVIRRLDETINIVSDVMVFVYFLNALILSVISFRPLKLVLFRLFRKKMDYYENTEYLESFRLKEYFIFAFIAGWMTVLLIDREYYFIYTAGLNTALILSCFYLIQAFGIIKFIFRKKNFPFIIIPVILLVSFFIGIEYLFFLLIVLSSIGVLDFWLDFRKLGLKEKDI